MLEQHLLLALAGFENPDYSRGARFAGSPSSSRPGTGPPIVREIARAYWRHAERTMSASLSSGPGLTDTSPRPIEPEHPAVDPLDAILGLVSDENRFDLTRIGPATVRRHVADRMRQRSIGSTSEYLALLRRSAPEVLALRTALLANGTMFFRDPKVWDFVAHDIIP